MAFMYLIVSQTQPSPQAFSLDRAESVWGSNCLRLLFLIFNLMLSLTKLDFNKISAKFVKFE